MRKFGVLIFFEAIISLFVSGCGAPNLDTQLADIERRSYLIVGTMYGPDSYYLTDDGAKGFTYEMAQNYAKYLDVELKIVVASSYADLYSDLREHRIDILMSPTFLIPEATRQFRKSISYQNIDIQLIYNKSRENRPTNIDELSGKLLVVADSGQDQLLQQIRPNNQNLSWHGVTQSDETELLEMVATGEINYTIASHSKLESMSYEYPMLESAFALSKQPTNWLFSQQNTSLLASANEFISAFKQSGGLTNLYEKYKTQETLKSPDAISFYHDVEHILPLYEEQFKVSAEQLDWRMLAAISYQESKWQADKKLSNGNAGLFMLDEYATSKYKITDPFDAAQNIRGAQVHISNLLNNIPARVSAKNRIWFALAAYKIGLNHLEDARNLTQAQGADPDIWINVKQRLSLLNQQKYYEQTRFGYANGRETVKYIENIRYYYDTLVWYNTKEANQTQDSPE